MTIGQISDIETAKNVKVVNVDPISVQLASTTDSDGSVTLGANSDNPLTIIYAGAEVNTAHVAAPAANAVAQVTFAAAANQRHLFEYIAWSYNAAPTGGNLTVHNGAGAVYFNIDITAAGPGFIPFTPEMSAVGSALYVTLTAGGAAVTGKVNVMGHRLG